MYVAKSVTKRYGGVQALVDVDFNLRQGEVHALLGANGAGKSTLVKVLVGAEAPSSGSLELAGEPVAFAHPEDAARHGVALVSQELTLFPTLDCLQNLFMMREPLLGRTFVRRREMRRRAKSVTESIGLDVDLSRPVGELRLGEQQLVEIARALLGEPRILILDEPTSALEAAETARLLEVVRVLRDDRVAVLFVSHFLADVFSIADRITILRSGRVVTADRPASELSIAGTILDMLGPAAEHSPSPQNADIARRTEDARTRLTLTVSDLSIPGVLAHADMVADSGEVVGLAGLDGSGARGLMRAIFGEGSISEGSIELPDGKPAPRNKRAAVAGGIAYVPADRKGLGLMLGDSITHNTTLVTAGPLGRFGLIPRDAKREERTRGWVKQLQVALGEPSDPVNQLSGGNQQKIVFAKWLDSQPSVVLLDDPTRGVDVGAKAEMQRLIRKVAADGKVVLYTSNDFEEMAAVCDRVYVFYAGIVIGVLDRDLSEHRLLHAVSAGEIDGAGAGAVDAHGPAQG